MKIGLLTYQSANNFGAALQAYALEKFLTMQGYDCEYINYICENVENRYRYSNSKSIKGFIRRQFAKKRDKSFQHFRKKIRISSKKFSRGNIAEANKEYDMFIVGSDQVWNYKLNGNDFTYLLNFSNKPRVAYASSIGLDDIEEEFREEYFTNLSKFETIMVRELSAKSIIDKLGISSSQVVLDPSFLLTDEYWEKMTYTPNVKDYILFYVFDSNNIKKFCDKYVDILKGQKFVKFGGGINLCDFIDLRTKVMYTTGPRDFLSYLRNAKLVVTDSFHATVFSIIFKTPFVVFYRNRAGKDARIHELLKIANLDKRDFESVTKDSIFSFGANNQEILEKQRENSRSSLLNCLINISYNR